MRGRRSHSGIRGGWRRTRSPRPCHRPGMNRDGVSIGITSFTSVARSCWIVLPNAATSIIDDTGCCRPIGSGSHVCWRSSGSRTHVTWWCEMEFRISAGPLRSLSPGWTASGKSPRRRLRTALSEAPRPHLCRNREDNGPVCRESLPYPGCCCVPGENLPAVHRVHTVDVERHERRLCPGRSDGDLHK